MNKNLILSVILCFFFTGGAFAQSGERTSGSNSRSYGSSSKPTRADRELASAKAKLVRQITRKDFEAVKLNRDQKKSLMSMVDSKYPQMVQLDNQIASSIPSDQVKALQKAYRKAEKSGNSEVEAMSMSMAKIGLSQMVQEKVLMMNQSKEDIRESIIVSIAKTFDQDQRVAFAAAIAAKKEMMGEEMADKEMAGEGEMMDKEAMADEEMMGKGMKDKAMTDEKDMSSVKKMMDKEMVTAE